jgi:DNA repair exonuclease SbcCD nuclease subunit
MRILHVTDSHLGVERRVLGAPRGYRRSDDHLDALLAALGPALREEVDLVVHSGDLFDRSRPPTRVLVEAAALLAEVARRTPILLVNGNHDWRGYRRAFPVPPPGLDVIGAPTRRVVGGVALAVVPWAPTAGKWAAAAREAVGGGADLLVCHQAFDGARVPGLTFRAGVQADTLGPEHLPAVPYALCGHIHPRQRVTVGGTLVVMPGSTERTSFSERDEGKGAAIWTLGRTVEARFVDGDVRPMVLVERREDLLRVAPGTLTRLATADVEPAEILKRGGFLAPAAAARPAAAPSPQLRLFAAGRI